MLAFHFLCARLRFHVYFIFRKFADIYFLKITGIKTHEQKDSTLHIGSLYPNGLFL